VDRSEKSETPEPPEKWTAEAWRFTVSSGTLAAGLTLFVNILTLVIVCAKYPMENNQVAFFRGSCHTSHAVTTVAHILINILSTILLAYSNFAMQCMNSPTRAEVDKAHSKQKWLNIGTPSIRNLFFISKLKLSIWIVLALSSLPLHMVWNSTVFETKSTHEYIVAHVTGDFLRGSNWTLPSEVSGNDIPRYQARLETLQKQALRGSLGELDVDSCIDAYWTSILWGRQDLLMIVNSSQTDKTLLSIDHARFEFNGADDEYHNNSPEFSYSWMGNTRPSPGDWSSTQKCYSQRVPVAEQCKSSIVPVFLGIVIVCNIAKGACFVFALRITKKEPPLCTTGDIIQSFLKEPDSHITGRCLVSKRDFERNSPEWTPRPLNFGDTWTGGRDSWIVAVNKWQVTSFMIFLCIAMSFSAAAVNTWDKLTPPFDLDSAILKGGAAISAAKEVTGMNILALFVLVNIPQVLVSYIYLGLNNIMTTMLVMAEWCGYSAVSERQPKGLRVSSPLPDTEQRSTYFLSLPYRWSIPIMTILTVIHWLVTEVFFLVQVDVHTENSGAPNSIKSIRYMFLSNSTLWFIVLPLGVLSISILVAMSKAKTFPASIPLAGCCSASIAAACQPSRVQQDTSGLAKTFPSDLATKALIWGVVERPEEMEFGIGHATFTADDVSPLEEDRMYT
jgi:uncharacterized membrane-anchored protein YitT (DUF2179 family)